MKLYLAPGSELNAESFASVIEKLEDWDKLPRELLMMASRFSLSLSSSVFL